jgi:hypothetical protein
MKRIRLGIAGLLVVALGGCAGTTPDEQIHLDAPTEWQFVDHIERLTDGERAFEGAAWNSDAVAFFHGGNAHATFDLGKVTPIEAAYVQGDNNDQFVLEASEDGTEFTTLWTAPAVGGPGLRARWASGLGGNARFIRISAIGGDSWVSASELQVFSSMPSVWPPKISVRMELISSTGARLALVLFAIMTALAVFLHRRESRKQLANLLWVASALCAAAAAYLIFVLWPVEVSVIDVSRAVSAAVACVLVLRLGLRPEHARKGVLTGLLGAMAFLSILTFYNYGHPQFYDAAKRRPTYVHTWDLRVYFPVVKYFDELGYDGVYLASVKAYADDELDGSLDRIGHIQLRDLRNYEMRRVSDVADEIHAVKNRFSAERWAELKTDMSYFWKTMGRRGYLDSLRDHGGNATPAWLWVAHLLYGSAEANEATFLWMALLDPLLLLIFFTAVWRTFGLRAALVCLIAYGATTIYQFGSNWGGSTLRNDWMVLLGLGACALKSRRLFLAGIFLGWGAMIRAFPVLALAFLTAPIAWKLVAASREARGDSQDDGSSVRQLLPVLKVGVGVVTIVLALGALSTATFGWDESWGSWSEKISMHANKPNINHVGLTALVGHDSDNLWHKLRERGEDPEQWGPLTAQTMKDRRWLLIVGMLFYTLLGLFACRGARLSDAAVIGTMMIPIYFYPSNYYLHILFIWPLLLAGWRGPDGDRDWSLIAASVLGFCALQWFGWLVPGRYGQFLFWSGMLLGLIAVLLVITVAANRRRAISGTA